MTRPANTARWQRPAKPPRSRASLALAIAVCAIGILVVSQYLAGYLFLWWIRADPLEARPVTIARYAYYYGHRADIRRKLLVTSAAGIALIGLGALPSLLPRKPSLHGHARFAYPREMARAGLFAPEGIFLGKMRVWFFFWRYIILGGQQGAIVSAPPRSDKGTAIVIPNALLWGDSLLCQDIKLEIWRITSGYRAEIGQECHLFNPLDPGGNTACYNPLHYVPADPNLRIAEIQRTGAILFPEVPGADPFWTSGGRGMFLGLTLYVLETPSLPATLGEVLRQGMATVAEGFSEHWKRIIAGRQKGKYPLSGQCVRAISDIMDLAPVTASSIRKTFTSRLDLWANPLIDAATSRNDFDFREMRKRRMSVFMGIQPADLSLLRPLVNLFIEQALSMQTRELPEDNPELIYQILALIDETTAPGKLPILAQAISYLSGFNVRLLLVVQALLSQLRETYGPNAAETMVKSLAARVIYAPKDFSEANEVSQELGFRTVRVKSRSKPNFGLFGKRGDRQGSTSISEQKRPLLLPQEVKELGRDNEIILYESLRPILAKKNRYFEDAFFKKRLLPPLKYATPRLKDAKFPLPIASMNVSPIDPDVPAPPQGSDAPKRRKQPPTVTDPERDAPLTIDDVDVDLSQVVVPVKPNGERLTPEELDTAVHSFLDALRAP